MTKAHSGRHRRGQAGANENETVTREMIEAGFRVLCSSGIADEYQRADKHTVAEIFRAMRLCSKQRSAGGRFADLQVKDGSLVVTPVDVVPTYDLDELIAKITPENLHVETDTGDPAGNEAI